jgi:hypothetical protein
MSNEAEQCGGSGQPEDPPKGACEPCDLGDVEGLACKAKRYEKQAEVMKQVAIDLETYKKQYADARKGFGDAWEATAAEIEGVRTQLDEINRLLSCLLSPKQKKCLDEAAEKEFGAIDMCAPEPGCCVGNCEFDDTVGENEDAASLTTRIDAYRRDTEANTACFRSLVAEAQTRADQVAKVKVEVTALATDSSGGDKTKAPRWYARWLIANHRLQLTRLGHGFATPLAYSQCLCKALQCIAAGWAAIAVLEGARAEKVCLEAAAKTECDRRTAGVLVTILDAYDCCMEDVEQKPPRQDGETGPEQTGIGQTGGCS